jgi:hypothetical protein
MKETGSFRLLIGLLAAAWVVVGVAVGVGLVQAGAAGEPIGIATLGGLVVGAIGLAGTWTFRKWGPILFLAGVLVLIVKPWVFGATENAGAPSWSFWVVLALFVVLVGANWDKFRN